MNGCTEMAKVCWQTKQHIYPVPFAVKIKLTTPGKKGKRLKKIAIGHHVGVADKHNLESVIILYR